MGDIETLHELIKDIRIAMMTTVDEDGTLRSRPMDTAKVEADSELWFFTYDPSGKTEEVRQDQQVNLSYIDHGKNRYVSVSGRAMISHDKGRMKEYWNPINKVWFPQGLDTPNLALLRVTAEKAEYWDAPSGKLVALVNLVKAAATGNHDDVFRNEKIDVR
jgi:general stress protein 26